MAAPNESPVDETLMATIRSVTAPRYPGSSVAPLMTSGVTDSAQFRQRHVPAYGFNPIVATEAELESQHGNDERVPVAAFREAVQTYYEVISRLVGIDSEARP